MGLHAIKMMIIASLVWDKQILIEDALIFFFVLRGKIGGYRAFSVSDI